MRPRIFTLALAVASIALGSPASAAEGALDAKGTIVVQASTTGKVRLHVPTDATIDLDPAPVITGEGSFVGFLLTEPGTRDGFYAEAIRYPASLGFNERLLTNGQKAVADREEETLNPLDQPQTPSCELCHIPPGDYDLYVIARGTPISVTLRLEGLDGELRLEGRNLTPATRRTTGIGVWKGNAGRLGGYASQSHQGDYDMGPGLAYTQYATSVDTDTTAVVERTFCVKTATARECDQGSASHTITPLARGEAMIGFPTWELAAGSYSVRSDLDVQNTVTDLTFETEYSGIFLQY